MADPQPASAIEGMDDPAPAPATAEDRKAAAAMNALESRAADNDEDNQRPTKQIDTEALGKSISRLELQDKAGRPAAEDPNEGRRKKKEEEQKEKERRAKIKVDPTDVGLLVEQLDLTKVKATELLRAHEGDVTKALTAAVRVWG